MENYIEIIKIGVIFFPIVAFFISIPFILIQYHKYGATSFIRSLIIYSFTLYFICSYFLVILPLPKISVVEKLTTPRMQLIPFSFIIDFIKNTSFNISDIHTYIATVKESYFFVPIYNIFLTIPFGIYLRYYFKCNLKKIIISTFILSLFFELTQLSGLYFIYPRGYRLFDIDDLILNTLGGVLGYFVFKPLEKILPKREEIDLKALKNGKKVTGFKRTTAFFFDLFLLLVINILLSFIRIKYLFIYTIIIYYFIIPLLLKCSTLGECFLNLRVLDNNDKINIKLLFFRRMLFIIIYIGIPFLGFFIIYNITGNIREIIGICFILLLLICYFIIFVKYIFTNKLMLYERISNTKLISTIK